MELLNLVIHELPWLAIVLTILATAAVAIIIIAPYTKNTLDNTIAEEITEGKSSKFFKTLINRFSLIKPNRWRR